MMLYFQMVLLSALTILLLPGNAVCQLTTDYERDRRVDVPESCWIATTKSSPGWRANYAARPEADHGLPSAGAESYFNELNGNGIDFWSCTPPKPSHVCNPDLELELIEVEYHVLKTTSDAVLGYCEGIWACHCNGDSDEEVTIFD